MIIHVVRHAEAIDRSSDISEEYRYLTRRGRMRFRKTAKVLRKAGIAPELILTSPLIRAVQTADILAEGLRHQGELQVARLLSPGFRPAALDELLAGFGSVGEIALVGHEPDLGLLARALLNVEEDCALPKGAVISFKRTAGDKGGTSFVQFVTGGGRIITSRSKALQRLQPQGISK